MAANFSRRTNNHDVPHSPFTEVTYAGDAPVMETELNESQDLLGERLDTLASMLGTFIYAGAYSIAGNKNIAKSSVSAVYKSSTIGVAFNDCAIISGKYRMNLGGMVMSIDNEMYPNGDNIAVPIYSGGAIYIKNKVYTKDDDGNITITGYDNSAGSGITCSGLYDAATNTVKSAILDASIYDDRIGQETTRREGFTWWFGKSEDENDYDYDVKLTGITWRVIDLGIGNGTKTIYVDGDMVVKNLLAAISEGGFDPNVDKVAIGKNAKVGGVRGVAVGTNTNAVSINAVAIGVNAVANNGIAIGEMVTVNDVESDPISVGGVVRNSKSIKIGDKTGANFSVGSNILPVSRSIMIGSYARPREDVGTATNIIAIGHLSQANNESIAIGVCAQAIGVSSISIGHNVKANYANKVFIGSNINSLTQIALGSNIHGGGTVSIGTNLCCSSLTAYGKNIYTSGGVVAVGYNINSGSNASMVANGITTPSADSIIVGEAINSIANKVYNYNADNDANYNTNNAIIFGTIIGVNSYDTIAIGRSISVKACTQQSLVIGHYINIYGAEANYSATAEDQSQFVLNGRSEEVTAIGYMINISNNCTGSIAIGSNIRMNNTRSSIVIAPEIGRGYGWDPGSAKINNTINSVSIGINNTINTNYAVHIFGSHSIVNNNSRGNIYGKGNIYTSDATTSTYASGEIHGTGSIIDSISASIYGGGTINGSNYSHIYGKGIIKNSEHSILIGNYNGEGGIRNSISSILVHCYSSGSVNIENSHHSIGIVTESNRESFLVNSAGSIVIGTNVNAVDSDNSIGIGRYIRLNNNKNVIVIGYPYGGVNYNNDIIIGNKAAKITDGISISSDSAASVNIMHSIYIGKNATLSTSKTELPDGKAEDGIFIGTNMKFGVRGMYDSGVAIGQNIELTKDVSYQNSYAVVAIGCNVRSGGDANTIIGHYARVNNARQSIAIGYGASCNKNGSVSIANMGWDEANAICLGDYSITKLQCKVALSTLSDIRDKYVIDNIEDGATEFLKKLQPIRYVRNDRDLYRYDDSSVEAGEITAEEYENIKTNRDIPNVKWYYGYNKAAHTAGTKKGERVRIGLSAQEILQALYDVYGDNSYVNIVDDNLHDLTAEERAALPSDMENKLTVTYENLIPFLIKSIQELSSRTDRLEKTYDPIYEALKPNLVSKSDCNMQYYYTFNGNVADYTGTGETFGYTNSIPCTKYTYSNGDYIFMTRGAMTVTGAKGHNGPFRKRINGKRYDIVICNDGYVWRYGTEVTNDNDCYYSSMGHAF